VLSHFFNPVQRSFQKIFSFVTERKGNYAHCEQSHVLCNTCYDRSCSRSVPPPHSGCDKDHFCHAFKQSSDPLFAFQELLFWQFPGCSRLRGLPSTKLPNCSFFRTGLISKACASVLQMINPHRKTQTMHTGLLRFHRSSYSITFIMELVVFQFNGMNASSYVSFSTLGLS